LSSRDERVDERLNICVRNDIIHVEIAVERNEASATDSCKYF
jgi:hypothetical protein